MTCAAAVSTDRCSCLYRQPLLDRKIFPPLLFPPRAQTLRIMRNSNKTPVLFGTPETSADNDVGEIAGGNPHTPPETAHKALKVALRERGDHPCRPASPQTLWQQMAASLERQHRSAGRSDSEAPATAPHSSGPVLPSGLRGRSA